METCRLANNNKLITKTKTKTKKKNGEKTRNKRTIVI